MILRRPRVASAGIDRLLSRGISDDPNHGSTPLSKRSVEQFFLSITDVMLIHVTFLRRAAS
jgi:hypothetical protein